MSGTRGQGARRRRIARRQEQRKQAMRSLTAAASGSTSLPLGDRGQSWDASAADKAVRSWAGATDKPNGKYAGAFFFKDGDGTKFGDYKLGFAQPVNGKLTANWGGITAVAGALQGARGGVQIPDADKAAIRGKVESYYSKAKSQYKDDSIKPPWQAGDGESAARLLAYAQLGPDADDDMLAIATFEWQEALAQEHDLSALEDLVEQFAPVVQGKLVWDEETGVMDLMDDLEDLLNAAGGRRFCVCDVATSMDAAVVCEVPVMVRDGYDADDRGGSYWLVPFTVGDDREPVLSPETEWTPLEQAWVEDTDQMSVRWRGMSARRAELAMGACANCDHAFAMHEGTDGACGMDGCECMSYQPVTDADGPQYHAGVTYEAQKFSEAARTFYLSTVANSNSGTTARFTFDFSQDGITIVPPLDAPATGGAEWSAIFAPEGKLTSDGRAFAPGAINWPRLDDGPLTLMAMTETSEGGHVGAKAAGRIDRIWRDDEAGLIRASGTFDTGEYGQEIARLVADQVLRGVSVDLAIHDAQAGPLSDYFDGEGNWEPKPAEERKDQTGIPLLDALYDPDDPDVFVVFNAEIGATTVCPFPAFGEARISLGDSLVAAASPNVLTVTQQAGFTTVQKAVGTPLTASAPESDPAPCQECDEQAEALTASAAGLVVEAPPASWFDAPPVDEPTGITVTDDGRVYGWAALWSSCHIGFPGRCQAPPHSNTNYAYFHLGEVVCDDGSRVSCGTITLDTGHAPTGGAIGRTEAVRHYDDTGTAVAYVRVGEDDHGIWFSGTLAPNVDAEKARVFMGGKPSGDWRAVDGNLELVAILTVNVPGFPVPRTRQGFEGTEVVSLVAAGIPVLESEISPDDLEKFRALRAMDELLNEQEAA